MQKKIKVMCFPEDIINQVNKDNWEELFDEYMITEVFKKDKLGKIIKPIEIDHYEYVWDTQTMKEFIIKLI